MRLPALWMILVPLGAVGCGGGSAQKDPAPASAPDSQVDALHTATETRLFGPRGGSGAGPRAPAQRPGGQLCYLGNGVSFLKGNNGIDCIQSGSSLVCCTRVQPGAYTTCWDTQKSWVAGPYGDVSQIKC